MPSQHVAEICRHSLISPTTGKSVAIQSGLAFFFAMATPFVLLLRAQLRQRFARGTARTFVNELPTHVRFTVSAAIVKRATSRK
jgi:hypothetical protein